MFGKIQAPVANLWKTRGEEKCSRHSILFENSRPAVACSPMEVPRHICLGAFRTQKPSGNCDRRAASGSSASDITRVDETSPFSGRATGHVPRQGTRSHGRKGSGERRRSLREIEEAGRRPHRHERLHVERGGQERWKAPWVTSIRRAFARSTGRRPSRANTTTSWRRATPDDALASWPRKGISPQIAIFGTSVRRWSQPRDRRVLEPTSKRGSSARRAVATAVAGSTVIR